MKRIQHISSKLAFQVDKKILALEEEDHYRMDIPAVGKLEIMKPRLKKTPLKRFSNFGATTMAIFALLFTISNAPAYTKLVMASFNELSAVETPSLFIKNDLVIADDDGIFPIQNPVSAYEDRIVIPGITNAPIVNTETGVDALVSGDWNELEAQIRSSLLKGVTHYPGTALPGEDGNVFLTGHSSNLFWETSEFNTVFALLPKVEVGQDIFISYNQENFHYKVTEKKEVLPTDVSVLEQSEGPTLTLMTCTPVGTTLKRLVVTAELII